MLSNELPSLAAAACYRLLQCERKGLTFQVSLPKFYVQGKVFVGMCKGGAVLKSGNVKRQYISVFILSKDIDRCLQGFGAENFFF